MANYTTTLMAVVLPTANVEKFEAYFRGTNEKHFYRTTMYGSEVIDKNDELSLIHYNLECAWNVDLCLIHPTTSHESFVPLKDVCEECDVRHVSIWSEEPGCCFFEYINYDKGDADFECLSADRPRQPNDLSLDMEDYE